MFSKTRYSTRVCTSIYNFVCVTIISKIKNTINPKILIEIEIANFIEIEEFLYNPRIVLAM